MESSPQTGQELIVSVPDEVNDPETAGGRPEVRLECFDRRRQRIIREAHPWPFVKDGVGDDLPHAHQRGVPQLLSRVTRCRLLGTDPALEGELPLAR